MISGSTVVYDEAQALRDQALSLRIDICNSNGGKDQVAGKFRIAERCGVASILSLKKLDTRVTATCSLRTQIEGMRCHPLVRQSASRSCRLVGHRRRDARGATDYGLYRGRAFEEKRSMTDADWVAVPRF